MSRFLDLITKWRSLASLLTSRLSDSLRKDWRKHAVFLFLLLTLTMIVTTIVSRIYQFWDVGSNSWFDRLKGDGWEFQRGAATIEQDQFGDRFSTVKYLKQGWTPADSTVLASSISDSNLSFTAASLIEPI